MTETKSPPDVGMERAVEVAPIDMLLWCPNCHHQHVDAPDGEWINPPHRSHLCGACGCVWRPADVATNGAAWIRTSGSRDTWSLPHSTPGVAVLAGGAIPCSLCQGPTICRDAGQCALPATMEDVCGRDEPTLEDRILALEQGGADTQEELRTRGARIAALEGRPEWTAEKESLLRMLGELFAGHLFWREGAADRSNSHKLIKLKNAAFPEPQS